MTAELKAAAIRADERLRIVRAIQAYEVDSQHRDQIKIGLALAARIARAGEPV